MGYTGKQAKALRRKEEIINEATRVVKAGLQMIQVVEEVVLESKSTQDMSIRVGVHSGYLVAGIIGAKIVRYDIFGEAVMTAQLME